MKLLIVCVALAPPVAPLKPTNVVSSSQERDEILVRVLGRKRCVCHRVGERFGDRRCRRVVRNGHGDRVAAAGIDRIGREIIAAVTVAIGEQIGADRVASVNVQSDAGARLNGPAGRGAVAEISATRAEGGNSTRVVLQDEDDAVGLQIAAGLIGERRGETTIGADDRLWRIEERRPRFGVCIVGEREHVAVDGIGGNP